MKNRLSVIIPVYNGEKYLEETLEGLITQTVEDFEVIIIDDGSTDRTAEIAKKYCEEYNGFFYIYQDHEGVYAARNRGIEKAKCEYLLFLDCGDTLTENSVEAIFECSDKYDADIITGRCWYNGDIEYEYDKNLDILATMPQVEMLESSLLKNSELGAKAIRKKLFDLYKLRFYNLSAYGEMLLIMQAVMKGVKISGCSELILEKTVKPIEDGYSQFEMPSYENLKSAVYVFSEIYKMGKAAILKQTGQCDGDESYCQEIVYTAYQFYIDKFYRRYWYMEERTIQLMKDEFEKYAPLTRPERFKKLQANNIDIRLPKIYTDKKEAAEAPVFTIFFDLTDEKEYRPFLRSLYAQTYPFFELLVSESRFNGGAFPDEFKKMENIRVLPDKDFHSQGRKTANAKNCLEIRNGKPMDIRTLRETCNSKMPAFFVQYVFAQKRKTLETRRTLKDKGFNIEQK
ncbi:MAG: glycosyltransferase [Clostridiales bacterium]|nr:glycosyltransferase [Clostridiales bacterium]